MCGSFGLSWREPWDQPRPRANVLGKRELEEVNKFFSKNSEFDLHDVTRFLWFAWHLFILWLFTDDTKAPEAAVETMEMRPIWRLSVQLSKAWFREGARCFLSLWVIDTKEPGFSWAPRSTPGKRFSNKHIDWKICSGTTNELQWLTSWDSWIFPLSNSQCISF